MRKVLLYPHFPDDKIKGHRLSELAKATQLRSGTAGILILEVWNPSLCSLLLLMLPLDGNEKEDYSNMLTT